MTIAQFVDFFEFFVLGFPHHTLVLFPMALGSWAFLTSRLAD